MNSCKLRSAQADCIKAKDCSTDRQHTRYAVVIKANKPGEERTRVYWFRLFYFKGTSAKIHLVAEILLVTVLIPVYHPPVCNVTIMQVHITIMAVKQLTWTKCSSQQMDIKYKTVFVLQDIYEIQRYIFFFTSLIITKMLKHETDRDQSHESEI